MKLSKIFALATAAAAATTLTVTAFADRDFISVNNDDVGADIFERGLCLPSDIKMTEADQMRVIKIIRELF